MKSVDPVQLLLDTSTKTVAAQFCIIFLFSIALIYSVVVLTRSNTYLRSHIWVWWEALIASSICLVGYRIWVAIVLRYPRVPLAFIMLLALWKVIDATLRRIDQGRSLVMFRESRFLATDFHLIRRSAVFVTFLLIVTVYAPALLGNSRITIEDVTDPQGLVRKISEPQEPVGKYIWGRLSSRTTELLAQQSQLEPNEKLVRSIVVDLNRLLLDPSLYSEQRFRETKLPKEIRELAKNDLPMRDIASLNRRLLEAAYPQEIRKSPLSSP